MTSHISVKRKTASGSVRSRSSSRRTLEVSPKSAVFSLARATVAAAVRVCTRTVGKWVIPYRTESAADLAPRSLYLYAYTMTYRDRGYKEVRSAETALRKIIGEALNAYAYKDVAAIAQVADALSVLAPRLAPDSPHSAAPEGEVNAGKAPSTMRPTEKPGDAPPPTLGAPTSTTTARREKYPHYRRDGDMLVKAAWSKKQGRPYEHRAPRPVLRLIVDKIRRRYEDVGDEQLFDASHLMPLLAPNDEEYPSYQVYLALGWLRQLGAVSKKGRAGYILRTGQATPPQLDAQWKRLPSTG